MIITYNALQSFKVQFGETVLSFNPVSKKSKYPQSNFGADVVLSTINHPDMNGVETIGRGDKQPFNITGPGEYEVSGVFIRGFATRSSYGGSERINTIYLVSLEEMTLCFLGALATTTLPQEFLEEVEDIDVLFVPVGDEGVLNPQEAHKLGVSLEPRIIIPMHYTDATLKAFLKEEGASTVVPVDKLTIKKKDVLEKEGEVVVLSPLA